MIKNFVVCLAFVAAFSPAVFSAENPYYSDKTKKSIKYYKDIIESGRAGKGHLFNLASVYKEFGENKNAFDLYREVILINEREARAHFELAKMYYFLNANTYAEEELKFLVRRNMVNWEIYYWWGCALLEQKKFDEAILKFNEAIQHDGRKVLIYIKLAEIYNEKGDIDNAIRNYKLALKKDRTFTELNKKIAYLYERKKDFMNAFIYWKKTGEIDTSDKKAAKKVEDFAKYFPRIKEKVEDYKEKKEKIRDAYEPPDKNKIEGAEKITKIEVGLVEDVRSIYFKCGSGFKVLDHKKNEIMKGEKLKEYRVRLDAEKKNGIIGTKGREKKFKNEIYIVKDRPEATTSIFDVQYGRGFYWSSKKDTAYRGDFKVVLRDNRLALVNVLNIEEYLFGVIPSEMPSYWPSEALKAQAVAARTYTFKHLGRHRKKGFDLCAQQHCAVYKGISGEHDNTTKAVNETKGEVLFGADYTMLDTFFSHSCGGHTLDISEVWGMRKNDSLRGVYDGKMSGWYFPLSPFALEEWVRTTPKAYCIAGGSNEVSFRWIRYLDAEGLEFFVNRRYKLGKIKKLEPVKRAKGGALVKVYIEGDKGKKTVGFDAMRNVLGKIRSNVIKWEYRKDADGYIKDIYIYGAGWGHGVGMCQRGAKGMAEKNIRYRAILYHYYPGSHIKKQY